MTTPNIEDLIYQLECDLYDWNNYVEVDTAPCPLDRYVAPALLNIKQALQSQAECIKALELDLDVQAGSIEAVQAVNARQAERIKALEAAPQVGYFYKWKDAMHGIAKLMDERDTLRAELAGVEACAADNKLIDLLESAHGELQFWAAQDIDEPECVTATLECLNDALMIARETKLFTCHMPAQDVTELVEALEKSIAQFESEIHNEYDGTSMLEDRLAEADYARTALSKYKGAK